METLSNYETGIVPPVTYSAARHLGTTALNRVQVSGTKWIGAGESVDAEKDW